MGVRARSEDSKNMAEGHFMPNVCGDCNKSSLRARARGRPRARAGAETPAKDESEMKIRGHRGHRSICLFDIIKTAADEARGLHSFRKNVGVPRTRAEKGRSHEGTHLDRRG
jgi:hypothetical protein